KWLVGEAIPTQEKIRALATWLGVSAEWLRFGTGTEPETDGTESRSPIDSLARELAMELGQLDAHHRELARQMIRVLVLQHEANQAAPRGACARRSGS